MIERFPLGIKDNIFKNVVDSTTLYGGVKKLENSHFKHKHGLDTRNFGTSIGETEIENDDEYTSYYAIQNTVTLDIVQEAGDNDDYLSKFNVLVFLIKYTNI